VYQISLAFVLYYFRLLPGKESLNLVQKPPSTLEKVISHFQLVK